MKIDIVLPYYNGSRYIQEQLESIKNCRLPENTQIRVLIVDDASSEEESRFLKNLLTHFDFIEIHRNYRNLGVVKSVEVGLSLTSAPYVMLCDQDDYWLSDKILVSINKLKEVEADKPALVFTDLKIVDQKLNLIHPSMFQCFNYSPMRIRNGILLQNMVTGCTIAMNRKLVEISLPFPDQLLIHDHWLAICATYAGRIHAIETPTILYRQHQQNLIGARYESIWKKLLKLKQKVKAKHRSHLLKSLQTTELSNRLKERGIVNNTRELELISEALKANHIDDVLILLRKKVINLRPQRKFAIVCFFITVAALKKIRN